ncbi:hypothetical protein QA649_37445 [Bradyrhizobium sp. CB1717]|uniref:hypothetical protein n=1 Tax=Bradyrhizobium sp. CB1717 TaxID=3039154 RepID=UPI0024B0FBB0|nr:hypothetical protein [Bradyrhizobium sp. CB1717]WFU23638.1 hypothetical protein QA649_37445 [Bradyrhizobium sp. CB1717]
MPDQVTKKPVPILVPWKAEVIPYACRKFRTVHVCETVHAEIRTPAPDEARVAFRLSTFHSRREGILPEGKMDVVYCDGALWWPVSPFTEDVRSPFFRKNRDNYIGADRLLKKLADGSGDLLALASFQDIRSYPRLVPFSELPRIRICKEHNRPQMKALAQRRASENLMIWKDGAYVRGGEPVYVQHPFNDGHAHSDDGMAGIGADRSVDPYAEGLPFDVGCFEYGQRAFMAGKFQAADQRALAEANRSLISRRSSKFEDLIEVLMPEAIKLDRAAVRLDAIYRAVDRALKADKDPLWTDLRGLFAEVSARGPKRPTTSADRYHAILRFCRLAAERNDLPEEMEEAYECFLSFEESDEIAALGSFPVAPEDDAALGELGEARAGQWGAAC